MPSLDDCICSWAHSFDGASCSRYYGLVQCQHLDDKIYRAQIAVQLRCHMVENAAEIYGPSSSDPNYGPFFHLRSHPRAIGV